ncbi:MAG: LamG domain-containing protein, partial [Pirellulales bacterium]|nr:LamG domain-containing protein [Pirellulales bacterium]
EAWVNPDLINLANDNGIVGKYNSSGSGNRSYVLTINNDSGKLEGTISDNGSGFESVSSASTIATGVWTHVAFVFDPGTGAPDDSTMTVYINGIADGTRSDAGVPDAIYDSTAAVEVGTFFNNNPTTGFDGLIDEVAIYSTALGSDRILAHYAASLPEPSSGLMLLMGLSGMLIRRRRRMRS